MHELMHDQPATREQFRAALLHFINVRMPESGQLKAPPYVDAFTPLFEAGPIDSMGILQLIGFIEKATGKRIPTRLVTMQHFRTVEAICDAFWPAGEEASR
jgi:acyl carrier protein